ncbi:sensor histidine kinase [Paenibacillus sp.]|uniref:cache domain-containing sensor histidine kinase n=1 Tax=Paenibacillus sp. TaxID=58172 RepID=UPI002D45C758|nr:sensor histidine kinase [Paenibacillus sp.]HZG57689.1 sensor histidine kinase [Paenibacillus sp.]
MTWIRTLLRRFTDQELAKKLIVVNCVLIVVPFGALAWFAYAGFERTMERNVGAYQLQTLKQVTLNIDTYMNELNRLSLMPYQYEEILDFLGSEREEGQPLTLEEIEQLNGFVSKVFINGRVDIMGVSLYGERGASYVVLPESQYITSYKLDDDAEWLKRAKGQFGQPTFITTHEIVSTSGTVYRVFSIARELRSFDTGETLGYIVIDIDPTAVRNILTQVKLGEQESLYIADKNGRLVIGSTLGVGDPASIGLLAGEGVRHLNVPGVGSLLVSHVTSGVTGWTTVSAVPVRELMEDSVVLRNSIALLGVAFVGLAMALSALFAFGVTKPLRKLSRLMRKVEQGDLQVSFPVASGDEVGRLGHAFNTMVSKLSELGYLLYETELREKDAQIAALQSKINPHFLYNTLGSISMYAELEGNKEIVLMSNNLSRLLRYSLGSRKETVTLRDELEHVNGYMAIQKLRYDERIDYVCDIEPSALDCRMIPLLLQPIVENALNHGIDKGVGIGRIRLGGCAEDGTLRLTVEDDGVGLTSERLESLQERLRSARDIGGATGNGLLNVHRRIRLHFGAPYGLTLESMPYQGVKVIMTLPAIRPAEPSETKEGDDAEHRHRG